MGFKAPVREYKLIFADAEMQGLEVVMRSASIAEALEFQAKGKTEMTELDRTDTLVRHAAAAMISWNLETEDGEPIPATYEGLVSQQGFIFWAIWNAWIEAISGVSGPLESGSTTGDSALEASIPMETLSPSLSS